MPLYCTDDANQVWSIELVFDRISDGRVIKVSIIVDDAKHEYVAIEDERVISGHCVRLCRADLPIHEAN